MSFRSRVAGLVALAVAVAFLLTSLVAFGATRRSLLAAVDDQLIEAVGGARSEDGTVVSPALMELRDYVERERGGNRRPGVRGRVDGPAGDVLRGVGLVQLVNEPRGVVLLTLPESADAIPLPEMGPGASDAGRVGPIETVRTDDAVYRTISVGIGNDRLLQVARPIGDIEDGLARLALVLALASVVGVGLAFGAGLLVAGRVLGPVRKLTDTAELIADTQDLAHRAEVAGEDELARLGRSLNRMLVALDASRRSQQQLVADASHELRTPLTSLRTNVELLTSGVALGEADRVAMRDDLVGQIEEMTLLIGNLVDLAREGADRVDAVAVDLDELVAVVVERQRRLHPDVDIRLAAAPSRVMGDRERLDRAVANLVDNAVKYAGEAGPIEVAVKDGVVTVRDHGPGVPEIDRTRVFDRFWRSPEARSAPGSGLGLAIVHQVAAAHGGTVAVHDAEDGGAQFELRLPTEAG